MARFDKRGRWALLVASAIAVWAGCQMPPQRPAPPKEVAAGVPTIDPFSVQTQNAPSPSTATLSNETGTVLRPVVYQVPVDAPAANALPTPSDLAIPVEVLSLDSLVCDVLAKNPSLAAMRAAWQAAAERYPQAISLDDPMFTYAVSPGIGTMGGWMAMGSQKFPWGGKRQLRGAIASAEADAACNDLRDTRVRLVETAKLAFTDYYLAHRRLEINATTAELLEEFRQSARVKYEAGQVTQQDLLQADLEIADLEGRRAELLRETHLSAARINTLLHRGVDCSLPPPPAQLGMTGPLPCVEQMRCAAIQRRSDLAAEAAKLRADEAAVQLAMKEYCPDVEVFAKYDAFMTDDNQRPQVGMNMNVPLRRERRSAAVSEAQAKLCQRRAEYQSLVDQVQLDVQTAFEQLCESQKIVCLSTERSLPTAEANVESAKANYTTGKIDFLRLIEAQRQLRREQEKFHVALADYCRRVAELERAIGGELDALPQPGN